MAAVAGPYEKLDLSYLYVAECAVLCSVCLAMPTSYHKVCPDGHGQVLLIVLLLLVKRPKFAYCVICSNEYIYSSKLNVGLGPCNYDTK